jgi:DNA anti-recombination protein RmuC
MKNDKAISGLEVVDRITAIHGPSAEELRRSLSKSLDQITREVQQGHERAVCQFKEEHSARR